MDIQVLIYMLAGVVIFFAFIKRIHYVADKYEQATDLLKEMKYCYQQISVIVKIRDNMQMEIAALTDQFDKESALQKDDQKGNLNKNHENFQNPLLADNPEDYSSGNIESEIRAKIQIKKE